MDATILSLLSILLGGGVAWIVINAYNQRREQYLFLVEKAEKLFGHTSDLVLMFPAMERAFEEISAGWIDITEFDLRIEKIDIDNPSQKDENLIPIGTQFYIRLYFPECADRFDQCVKHSVEACAIAVNLKDHYMYLKEIRKHESVDRIDEFHQHLGLELNVNSFDSFVKSRQRKFLEMVKITRQELRDTERCILRTLDRARLGWLYIFSSRR